MSKRQKKINQHLNVANIMRRMPLHRQLNASQAMLVKLSPCWLSWSAMHLNSERTTPTNPSDSHLNNYQLTNYQSGKLTIHCDNSINASQIKHQQKTLLAYFHNQGFEELEQIIVRISHPTSLSTKNSMKQTSLINKSQPQRPSNNSLAAIKNCQKIVKNDHLSNSLSKLEQTLKNFGK